MRTTFLYRIAIAITFIAALGVAAPAVAQSPAIKIWPGPPPGSEDWQKRSESEIISNGLKVIHNVVEPTLTPFLPDPAKANGTAVVICPGGGFRLLVFEQEGMQVAQWLKERGVAAFVLKYRLADTGTTEEDLRKSLAGLTAKIYGHADPADRYSGAKNDPVTMAVVPLAVADGLQAIKLVRRRAAEFHVAPDRIGIMGFSAGGGVTTGVALESDAESRPNFAAPIYGGIFSEKSVTSNAPPVFVVAADDDPLAGSSIMIASRWKAAKRPVELHIYAKGGHGFGMKKQGLPVDHWIDRFGEWLDYLGYLKPADGSRR